MWMQLLDNQLNFGIFSLNKTIRRSVFEFIHHFFQKVLIVIIYMYIFVFLDQKSKK